MNFDDKTVFITGTNRGIGKALVEACLEKKVKKVYASMRKIENLPQWNDSRVVPILLDVSDAHQITKATRLCSDTQILINNAGTIHPGNILSGDLDGFRKDMEVNCFALITMMRAFTPVLEKNKDARIVNIASIANYANFPFIAGYSASKAAAYSASQAARIELSAKNIPVHIVNPGAIDTDMNKGNPMPMTSPTDVARSILSEVEKEVADIIPDRIGRELFSIWQKSPGELEAVAKKMYFGN